MDTRVSIGFLFIVILLTILLRIPNALAQTTTITDVNYTKTALYDIDRQTSSPQLLVNATVNYADARSGYYLAAGIFDLDDGNLVDGLGSSNPQSCSKTTEVAGCTVPLTNPEGSERMQFSLRHPKGVWNLALVATILDAAYGPISNSFSDYTFTIFVRTALTLVVDLPDHVPVSVDGANGTGSIQLVLAAGNHSLSVPDLVQVSNGTRLRFSKWSDGVTETTRSVELNQDITLTAYYTSQYQLRVISPVAITGSGWYDDGSNVTLSLQSTSALIGGFLGIFGGAWFFQGWVEDGHTISNSTTLLVTMNSPRVILVAWRSDYRAPLIILALIMTIAAFMLYLMSKKTRTRKVRLWSQSHRRKLVSSRLSDASEGFFNHRLSLFRNLIVVDNNGTDG